MKKIIKILISVGLLVYLYFRFDVSIISIWENAIHAEYLIVSFAMVLFVIPTIVVNRWKYFLALVGIDERFFQLYKISHVSQFLGFFCHLPPAS